MRGPRVLPWTFRVLLCVIASLFILTDLASGQGPQETAPKGTAPGPAPLPSSPSVPAAKPEAVPKAACTYAISPAGRSIPSAEEAGGISVTAGDKCSWTARSGAPWITVSPEAGGTGNGMITYYAGANQGAAARLGTITIGGQVFQLTQAAAQISQYTLTTSKAGSGQGKLSSSPGGNIFKKGTWVALRAVPDDDSVFAGWNGACSGRSTGCNLQMTSDRTVTATFTLKTYTIHVPLPVNGVIHPSGAIKAAHGEKRRFQVIPLPGYRVSDVLVDKASVGAVNSYTFDNVRADHVLEAVFAKQ